MMYYVCIENQTVISILNYQPSVPFSVSVVEISDDQYSKIVDKTHYFDVVSKTTQPVPLAEIEKRRSEEENTKFKEFLNSTDWMILRHLRQKTLGMETTLSEEKFFELEQSRNEAAAKIK